jgi:nicotinamidase-related amidase
VPFDPQLNIQRFAVERKGTAVIVIDMQNDFVHEKGALSVSGAFRLVKPLLPNISRLISSARQHGMPVVYTRQVSRPDQFDALPNKSLNIPRCVQGTWGAEILDEIKPNDSDYVVDAPRRDRFFDSRLELILRKLGVSTLLFTGYASDGCVESTVRGADARDYKITVLSDCTASDNPSRHDAALLCMSRVAMIASVDAVLQALEVKATA